VRLHFLQEENRMLDAHSFPVDVWSKLRNAVDYNESQMEYYVHPTGVQLFLSLSNRERESSMKMSFFGLFVLKRERACARAQYGIEWENYCWIMNCRRFRRKTPLPEALTREYLGETKESHEKHQQEYGVCQPVTSRTQI
jgi:hypothetical protein